MKKFKKTFLIVTAMCTLLMYFSMISVSAVGTYATFSQDEVSAGDTVTVTYTGEGVATYYHWLAIPPENYVDGVLTGEWYSETISDVVGYGDTITIPESAEGKYLYVQVWTDAYVELQNSGTPLYIYPVNATFSQDEISANDSVTVTYTGPGEATYYHWLAIPPENYVDGVLVGEWWTHTISDVVGYGDTITVPESAAGKYLYVQIWTDEYVEIQNSGTPLMIYPAYANFDATEFRINQSVTVTYTGPGEATYYNWLAIPPENFVDGVLVGEWWTYGISATVGYTDTITIPADAEGKYLYVQVWTGEYVEIQNTGIPYIILGAEQVSPAVTPTTEPTAIPTQQVDDETQPGDDFNYAIYALIISGLILSLYKMRKVIFIK